MNKVTYVLHALCKVTAPGKKVVQKFIYLAERKGLYLGMDYCIHFYGPYSSDLDEYLHTLEASDVIKIDLSGNTHKLSVLVTPDENPLSDAENIMLSELLNNFANKTPLDLEVLTTTDYVAHTMLKNNDLTTDAIVSLVKQIKGSKFSEQQISQSIKTLCDDGYLKVAN